MDRGRSIKLKAEIWETTMIPHLKNIVQIYGKQVKFMAIKFTTDHVYLISENDVLTGSSKIWTEIPKASLFQEYDFEGCGSENHLYLRTPCDNLSDVLKGSVHGVKLLRIRLRGRDKNSKPCLQFEYDQGQAFSSRTTKKSIDVEIVHHKYWDRYEELSLPPFDICSILPPLLHLKSFVDKCKTVSNHIDIAINSNSKMELRVMREGLDIERHFPDIQLENEDERLRDRAEISVDVKKLNSFLRVLPTNANYQIYCKIVQERYALFTFLTDQISVQFILPHYLA